MTTYYDNDPAPVIDRVRYFNNEFLDDQAFIDDQMFHIAAQRRHASGLHLAGVVSGLQVTSLQVTGAPSAILSPGYAYDGDGRQILVGPPVAGASGAMPIGGFDNGAAAQRLYLRFGETETRQQTTKGAQGATRYQQTPVLEARAVGAARPVGSVLLAEIRATGPASFAAVDMRELSGLAVPAAGDRIALASGQDDDGTAYLGVSHGARAPSLKITPDAVSFSMLRADSGAPQALDRVSSAYDTTSASPASLVSEAALQQALAWLVPPGSITAYGGTTAPQSWLACDGRAVSRATYAALFAAIGTSWGAGDGATTFNLPDLRGRFLRGQDAAAGRDPDVAQRAASAPGGNTGDQVGSVQGHAFGSHNHGVNDGGHNHSVQNGAHSHGISDGGHSHTTQAHGHSVSAFTQIGSLASRDGFVLVNGGGSTTWDIKTGLQGATAQSTVAVNGSGANVSVQSAASNVSLSAAGTGVSIQAQGGSETRPSNANVGWIIKY